MAKDKFGRPATSINFGSSWHSVAWDNQSTPGVIYLRGSYDDNCPIMKVDKTAGTIQYAFGSWTNRTTLTYGDDRLINC